LDRVGNKNKIIYKMENFNGTVTLSLSEMMAIEGGSIMYDLGHFVGSVTQGVIICVIAAALLA
jgi:hypothetical protein